MKRFLLSVLAIFVVCAGCRGPGLPEPGSKTYGDFCSDFYLGLAGLQSGEDVRAKEYLTRATQIGPGEPAAWADLGILQVRQQQFDAAFQTVDKARTLAPTDSRIEALLGLIESRRGHLPEAVAHLKKAISLDARNLKALYSLAGEFEREGGAENTASAQQLLKQILGDQPRNTAALLDDLRLAAKREDTAEAQHSLSALRPLASAWPDPAREQYANIDRAIASANIRPAAVQVQFLRNVLLRVPSYRSSLDQIQTPPTLVAQPFTALLRMPSPSGQAAPLDAETRFHSQPLAQANSAVASWVGAIPLDDQGAAAVAWADTKALHVTGGASLDLPGGALNKNSVAPADLNYDFKTDISIATAAGLKIYQQQDAAHFRDITSESKIPPAVVNAAYTGVWAFDFDLDGDLDLVLGVPHGDPVVLRNNADGTFTATHPFQGMDGLTQFAAADLDGDGDPDVALVDATGKLHVFLNERLGSYKPLQPPANLPVDIQAIAAADINGDGILDLALLAMDGSVVRLSLKPNSLDWESATVAHAPQSSSPRLFLADLDNNGALDIAANKQVFLNDGKTFTALPANLDAVPEAVSDLNSDGRLDLLALNAGGAPVQLINAGVKKYQWQVIRTRAAHAVGDQRMNSFGIGGEMEIRAGLLAEKQIINSPILHFGLGEQTMVQFARIVWPNGFVQAEFDLKADQTVLAEQRIKGSCPMLFAWDGQDMKFLKDVGPWGSALGLNVNAQGKGIYGTREWFNVRGSQLPPHDGFYDLRITAEYWETYYMDHYSLLAIDHPAGSEVYTDERFALPSPVPNLIATTETKPFARATDDHGADVTALVRDLDNRFLGTFCLGQYQGLAADHWVELELPADAPSTGPLYLVGQGWIHDTDATIVKAQAQNSKAHPQGMSIQTPDAAGRWTTVREGLGFPKGRVKTIILDIGNIFKPGAARKLRLRTNLELYWDKLAWGAGLPLEQHIQVTHLPLAAADLRFRGFSLITKANDSSPELPHYDQVQESDLRWHDQEGYATRYGEVRDLLKDIDDRYVITSPGDELRMKFAALPPAAPGSKRDFILICDGWVKDGDYNSTFAGTILPLPYHAMTDYVLPPTTLEADYAYQLHPDDWRTYQTRYVSPAYFTSALWRR